MSDAAAPSIWSRPPDGYQIGLTLAWIATYIALQWGFASDAFAAFLFYEPWCVVGLCFAAWGVFQAWKIRRFVPAAIVTLLLMPMSLALHGTWRHGAEQASFWSMHARYDAAVADIRAGRVRGNDMGRLTVDGMDAVVDGGPPIRVAFSQGGLLDNWTAIVWDPSGAVAQARGFDPNGGFTAPDSIRALFGGDLVSCRAMGDDYFRCSFT